MELLHQLSVSFGHSEVVVVNQRTINTDGLCVLDTHVLFKAGDDLLQSHFIDGVFGCGIEMGLVNTLSKQSCKLPTTNLVGYLLYETHTLVAGQMDVGIGHAVVFLALLVELLVAAVLQTIDFLSPLAYDGCTAISIIQCLEVRNPALL